MYKLERHFYDRDARIVGEDLVGDEIFVEDDGYNNFKVEKTKRINIDYAEEAKDFLWRYLMKK
ncbi:MAG: hypothetical protein WBJ13_00495 [Sedimentibacter sp.]